MMAVRFSHRERSAVLAAIAWAVVTATAVQPLAAQRHAGKHGLGLFVTGSDALPDLARGNAAAAEGRVEDAERDLAPLAERGYFDAQLALGRLYAQQRAPEFTSKALRWLRVVQPRTQLADVPLAHGLVRDGRRQSLSEAEQLLWRVWEQRADVDALAELISLYA